jgi:hypothetical protein
MSDFNLQKFLIENKMTRNSRLLKEDDKSMYRHRTPEEKAKELIGNHGEELAIAIVDEILKMESLQEYWKEYWRAVKNELTDQNM